MMKNIILITIDSLRADYLGCYGYHKRVTPAIDSFAKDGVLFNQAISTGVTTPISFPGILASRFPKYNQADYQWRNLPKDAIMISELLREEGYKTAAIHSNPMLSRYYGYDRGFDFFDDSLRFKEEERRGELRSFIQKFVSKDSKAYKLAVKAYQTSKRIKNLYRTFFSTDMPHDRGRTINQKAISWLKENRDSKFFLWLHYMDAHGPYIPPEEYIEDLEVSKREAKKLWRKMISQKKPEELKWENNLTTEDLKKVIELYEGEIRYTDDCLEEIFDSLKEMGLYDNSLIILTADHGEEFMEHGWVGHIDKQKPYDELIHVPLIIKDPDLDNKVVDNQVSLLGLVPTILDLSNCPRKYKMQGKSFMPIIKGEDTSMPAVSEGYIAKENRRVISYRTQNWKYIMVEGTEKQELYNLRKDPKERESLVNEEEGLAKEFKNKLTKHLNSRDTKIDEKAKIKEKIKKMVRKQKRRYT